MGKNFLFRLRYDSKNLTIILRFKIFSIYLFLGEALAVFATLNSKMPNDTKKSIVHSQEKKETHFTLLTLLYCVKILVGYFIDSFSLIAMIFSVDIYVTLGVLNITGNSLLFASHGVSIFLYFFFNKIFKRKFLEFFRLEKPKIADTNNNKNNYKRKKSEPMKEPSQKLTQSRCVSI